MTNTKRKTILIITHAPSENTLLMRNSLLKGATNCELNNTSVKIYNPFEATPKVIKEADGIILGTTENLGYMSGALKDFFDRIYYPCLSHTQGMPYALCVRAGHDGTGTKIAVEKIATGLRWKLVAPPLICRGEWQQSFLKKCEELGTLMAIGIDDGIF